MNWLHTFWFDYWWSSIKGNAPEDVTSLILVGIVTAVLVPAVRHWIERHVHSEFRLIHEKIDASHALMHHIITQHPDIDNHVPGLDEKYQPPAPRRT